MKFVEKKKKKRRMKEEKKEKSVGVGVGVGGVGRVGSGGEEWEREGDVGRSEGE